MQGEMPACTALPALLATQLLSAELYSHFAYLSSGEEWELWAGMLRDEMDHTNHLHRLFESSIPSSLTFPAINVERLRDAAQWAHQHSELFLQRLEGALRLECAELDYGLEGLVARRLEKKHLLPDYPGDVRAHITTLLETAERYAASPNIGLQASRLRELFDTCLATGNDREESASGRLQREK
jgi:hypothetical protein